LSKRVKGTASKGKAFKKVGKYYVALQNGQAFWICHVKKDATNVKIFGTILKGKATFFNLKNFELDCQDESTNNFETTARSRNRYAPVQNSAEPSEGS
jgi:hypothetical protein